MILCYLFHFLYLFQIAPTIDYLESFDELKLTDETGSELVISKEGRVKMTAVIFLYPECPISNRYGNRIRSLQSNEAIQLIGVQPNPNVSNQEIVEYKKEYSYDFPIVNDPMQFAARLFNAKITPEVFLLDTKGSLVYSGAIDNWFIDLGVNRSKPTELYLTDAISATKNGELPEVRKTKAIGCLIEEKHHH